MRKDWIDIIPTDAHFAGLARIPKYREYVECLNYRANNRLSEDDHEADFKI